MADYQSQYTGAQHDAYVAKESLIDLIYPVGAIYMSVNSVSPSTLFGGTWEQIQDTFLLACGTTYSGGSTGGSNTHKHTTQGHTLTIAEMPSHRHQEYYTWSGAGSVGGNWKVNMTSTGNGGAGTWTHTSGLTDVGATGGAAATRMAILAPQVLYLHTLPYICGSARHKCVGGEL